jgi:hypothetical protein
MSQYTNQPQQPAPGQYPPYQQPPQGQPPSQYPQQPGFPHPAWQQPMHQQYPPQYPPPPPQPPQRKKGWIRRHPFWSILIALLLLSCIVGALNDQSSGTTAATSNANASPTVASTQPASAPTVQPTLAPTIQPTPKTQQVAPTQPAPATGDPVLGAPIGTFITRFGQPKQMGTGYYSFQNDSIEANFSSDNDKRTLIVSRNAPNNQEFTLQDGRAACVPFLPADATYTGKHMTQYNSDGSLRDEQYVYVSPLLGKAMPASIFTDEKGNNTTPGTIGLILTYDATIQGNTTQFLTCDDEAGLESS